MTENDSKQTRNAQAKRIAEASRPIDRQNIFIFMFMVEKYGDEVDDLSYTSNDGQALYDSFTTLGVAPSHIELLSTKEGTRDFSRAPIKKHFDKKYGEFLKLLRKDDVAIVILGGHGLEFPSTTGKGSDAYLLPADCDTTEPGVDGISEAAVRRTSIAIADVMNKLENANASFRLLIVDACRKDPNKTTPKKALEHSAVTRGLESGHKLKTIEDVPDSVALVQSSSQNEFSYEGGTLRDGTTIKNGLYTYSLLEALDPKSGIASSSNDGKVSMMDVLHYAQRRTEYYASECFRRSQRPTLSGSNIGDFYFFDAYKDGVSLSDWNRAQNCYKEANSLNKAKKYAEARQKIDEALAIRTCEEYETLRDLIDLSLRNQRQNDELRQKERELREAEEARKKAEAKKPKPDPKVSRNDTPSNVPTVKNRVRKKLILGVLAVGAVGFALINNGDKSATPERQTSVSTSVAGFNEASKGGERMELAIKGKDYAFRYCPAGSFMMGSPSGEEDRADDEVQHRVTLSSGFWLLETETTQGLWKSVMGGDIVGSDDLPVTGVSWEDCQDFIEKLNAVGIAPTGYKFSLPTEGQWEYACRAGTTGAYNCKSLDSCGWYAANSGNNPHEVKQKSPNAWGLYDMHGNVLEWCLDRYGAYPTTSVIDRMRTRLTWGSYRVLRGGGWYSDAKRCRSASRGYGGPSARGSNYGFRLALVRQ